jgi:hypothetical protein
MPRRMVHYVGGPADGLVQLMKEDHHPFVMSLNSDTDGYYDSTEVCTVSMSILKGSVEGSRTS